MVQLIRLSSAGSVSSELLTVFSKDFRVDINLYIDSYNEEGGYQGVAYSHYNDIGGPGNVHWVVEVRHDSRRGRPVRVGTC